MKILANKYDHSKVEENAYDKWLENGYFKAGDMSKKPYCIVIPPPNVTGKLHIGHTWDTSLQDILARYKRLQGFDVLYLPGMDHAGIATQAKIDNLLKQQGISRYDIGREKFLEKAWEWKHEYAGYIREQWKKMGIGLDFSRERFTLDEGLNKAVNKVFVDLYKDGLIYQDYKIINWDPVAKTALSNIEVYHKEIAGKMYYFNYKVKEKNASFVVATTRPETMFGDVCIVVHPDDERYKDLIGLHAINPANNCELPIIADEYIDISFGTGAMKCTPAHDPNDFLIAERHKLEKPICMNLDATMNELAGDLEGLDRYVAREKITNRIKEEGNLVKIEEIVHPVGHSERTHVVIEPYLSKQWFVKMKPLANDVLENQKNDETKINFYPIRFEKTFKQWLENIEDWCISRQLWWGHRIPAYYHKETGEILVSENAPDDIENYIQDEDVLDTWFSSALWPFSSLGWPNKTDDFERYYPTSCIVVGYDIIFFWVARMAIQARYFTNSYPFKDALIHGLVRAAHGKKMSKSLGNGIDPLDIKEKYGIDSLRFYLTTNSTPGQDVSYNGEKVEAAWNFINKLWNASRFVMMNIKEEDEIKIPNNINSIDKWIINKLNNIITQVEKNMDRYEFAIASNELYSFIWDDYCSQYIEFAKNGLNSSDKNYRSETLNTLVYVLDKILVMLSPYIPFVTDEIYRNLFGDERSVNKESWPTIFDGLEEAKDVDLMIEIIKQVRELKSTNNLKPSKILKVKLNSSLKFEGIILDVLEKNAKILIVDEIKEETIVRTFDGGSISFVLNEVVDKKEEISKLEKEIEKIKLEIDRARNILNNQNFISKAPKEKVDSEKNKLKSYEEQLEICIKKLAELK